MENNIVKKVQNALIEVSLKSIGRSVPLGMYEKEIPEAVLKLRDRKEK